MNKSIALLFTLVLMFAGRSAFAQLGDPTGKTGIIYKQYFDAVMNILSTQNNAGLSNEALQKAHMGGPTVFYELLLTNYFGLGGYAGQFLRQTEIRIDSIDSVLEDNNVLLGVYAKAYSEKNKRNGLNWFGSVHYEIMSVNVSFSNAASSLNGKLVSSPVSIMGISYGLDYKLKFAALRTEMGVNFGEQRFQTDTHLVRFSFNTFFMTLGIMSVF